MLLRSRTALVCKQSFTIQCEPVTFILWYSAEWAYGRIPNIVMVLERNKRKTRRSLVEAAFSQLGAERSFANLSLREGGA